MKHPKLLTLTMPLWLEDPHDGIRHIRRAFAKLRRTRLFDAVVGGAYQIEVKIKGDHHHIHMHVLCDMPYIPYQRIFLTWGDILHVRAPQIDIRAAKSDKAREYVAKYASKSAGYDTQPEHIVAWYEATKGERLFTTFGKWYNATIESLDPDTPHPEPGYRCPKCEETKTVFLARDGPWIWGFKEWTQIHRFFDHDEPSYRYLEGADVAVTTPWSHEERKEFTCKNNKFETASQLSFETM